MIRNVAARSPDPGWSHAARPDRGTGQALVEFALILPLFLLLTLGVVDLSRVFASYIALTDGVREAALYAAEATNNTNWCAAPATPPAPDNVPCPPGTDPLVNKDPNPNSANNIAFQLVTAGLVALDVRLDAPICTPSPCDATSTVTIRAEYDVDLITPVLGEILGSQVTLSARTTASVLP